MTDILTDTNVNLTRDDLTGNLVHGGETRRALAVNGSNGSVDRDTGVQRSHTSSGSSASGRQDIANNDVLNELGIHIRASVCRAQDTGKQLLRTRVFETALLALKYAKCLGTVFRSPNT